MESVFIIKRKLTNQASMLGIVIGEIVSDTDNCYYILHKRKLQRVKKDLIVGRWDQTYEYSLYDIIESCYNSVK